MKRTKKLHNGAFLLKRMRNDDLALRQRVSERKKQHSLENGTK